MVLTLAAEYLPPSYATAATRQCIGAGNLLDGGASLDHAGDPIALALLRLVGHGDLRERNEPRFKGWYITMT
jgi:hypothetical protein